jgi:hypothetical protein
MKKLVNLLTILTLASCFTLIACGDDDDNTATNPGVGGGGTGNAPTAGQATAGQAGHGGT